MSEFYRKKEQKTFSREAIIGLGEDSFRKNYYPELQQKIMDLEQINARNRAIISTIPDILLIGNQKGEITPAMVSDSRERIIVQDLLQEENVMELLSAAVNEVADKNSFLTKEFQFIKEGNLYYLEARLHKTETNEILIMIRNMTDRILLERRLRKLVDRDPLTGLYNRRKFEEKMKQYNVKEFEKLVIVTFDINGLKFINDTLGHLCGDQVIIAAADRISRFFGNRGIFARIGGDEFAAVIEGYEEEKFEELLNKFMKEVDIYNSNSENPGLSLAFGYGYHKNGLVNMEYLFQEADNNMYQNKLLKKDSIRNKFVKTFMKALEAKDFVSEGHVMRTEKMAVLIGDALSLHQDQMDRLVLLTKFHDIGKIGIPDNILKKPSTLNEDEWKVMKTHSAIGERIALEAAEIKDIAHLILKHHEKWDGTGYPLGLAGEDIPMECRIVAIVDAYDAITNDRPYHAALSTEEAANEIVRCSRTQFDPKLVRIFMEVYSSLKEENDK